MPADEKRLDDLHLLFKQLQDRVAALENRENGFPKHAFGYEKPVHKKKLREHIAENIGSVVGLREAITIRNRLLQAIWTVLFCTGVALTIYFIYKTSSEYFEEHTATKVKLIRQKDYPYPPLMLCSNPWVDYQKTKRIGLSEEALQYSLGYFILTPHNVPTIENFTSAKNELNRFFIKNNFSSLQEYFKYIAVDLRLQNDDNTIIQTSYYSCDTGCHNRSELEKVMVLTGICYTLPLRAATSKTASLDDPNLYVHISNKLDYSKLQAAPTLDLVVQEQVSVSPIRIEPQKTNVITVKSQQFSTVDDSDQPCISSEKNANYSQISCVYKCLRDSFDFVDCPIVLPPTELNDKVNPFDHCNIYQLQNDAATSRFNDSFQDKLYTCSQECLQPCDRTLYEIFTTSHSSSKKFPVDPPSGNNNGTDEMVISAARLQFEHAARQYGGIMVLSESYTFSFSTLVSNVGGVFGLFIGATSLTFFQVFLFFVAYIFDRRSIISEE